MYRQLPYLAIPQNKHTTAGKQKFENAQVYKSTIFFSCVSVRERERESVSSVSVGGWEAAITAPSSRQRWIQENRAITTTITTLSTFEGFCASLEDLFVDFEREKLILDANFFFLAHRMCPSKSAQPC